MSSDLLTTLRHFCREYGWDKTYFIAYSGGLDSHVLLSLCHSLRSQFPIKLRAIHVNHNLSPHAQQWAQHCATVCAQYEIDFIEQSIQLNLAVGESLEAVAREKRYAVFAQHLNQGDILLTAHQQNDQAETVLLQLLRGSGPKGLAAMPLVMPFANGLHGRPLLPFSRANLQDYAESEGLVWIDDESNANLKHARNFIRHDILSVLKSRWPTVEASLSRTATHCAEAQALLEEFSLELCENVRGSRDNTLSAAKLLQLTPAQQRLVLRAWIESQGFPLPNRLKMESILQTVLTAAWDKMPCVRWQQAEVRRYRDDIFIMPVLLKPSEELRYTWDLSHPLSISGIGTLHAEHKQGLGLRADIKHVSIQFRRGGETIFLGKQGNKTLKNLFQEKSIPPWERARIPLLFAAEQCIAAVGYFIHQDYAAKDGELGYEISVKDGDWGCEISVK